MANPEHLAVLQNALSKQDTSVWNRWLTEQLELNPEFSVDLSAAPLRGLDLRGANFTHTDLRRADLRNARLDDADLSGAYLRKAFLGAAQLHRTKMHNTNLTKSHFFRADLTDADLAGANLGEADFNGAELERVNFAGATASNTLFANVNLATARGLETVNHASPSTFGIDTLYASHGNIPEIFLRGCGIPENMITFAKSLVNSAIEYYSCFISYSTADELFANRLHNDLQANGVRVWFAPQDLRIGDPIKDTIDQAVRLYDKLILILSENSISRAWVRHEFTQAFEKEKQHHKLVLFPIRLDNSVFDTTEQWAYDIKQRHIGDFTRWENPFLYQNSINRLLRDLNASPNHPTI